MCEYQRFNPNNEKALPVCSANNTLCTFCVLGNGKTYRFAKEKECAKMDIRQVETNDT